MPRKPRTHPRKPKAIDPARSDRYRAKNYWFRQSDTESQWYLNPHVSRAKIDYHCSSFYYLENGESRLEGLVRFRHPQPISALFALLGDKTTNVEVAIPGGTPVDMYELRDSIMRHGGAEWGKFKPGQGFRTDIVQPTKKSVYVGHKASQAPRSPRKEEEGEKDEDSELNVDEVPELE